MDSTRLKRAGYYSLVELASLSGCAEADLRAAAVAIGIVLGERFGREVVPLSEARRLLTQVVQNPPSIRRDPHSKRPGFSPDRMADLMHRAIADLKLNLSGMTVVTEAATGAYGVTAVIAALAGADVFAVARAGRYGSIDEATKWTTQLADAASYTGRINVVETLSPAVVGRADIVTNSGHLRPLTASFIDALPASAVIALMFEAWEFRASDIDLAACARRGIPVVGVNERHEAVDVFSYLGPLCAKQLHDCGLPVYRNQIALICDNAFADPILRGLKGLGAKVDVFAAVPAVPREAWDAVVVALLPSEAATIGRDEAQHLAAVMPKKAALVQFWGDVDRAAAFDLGLTVWPATPPAAGHMAVLLSDIGPEPIVRLQSGGLAAAARFRFGGMLEAGGLAQVVPASEIGALEVPGWH